MSLELLHWLGAIGGAAGSLLLALNVPWSRWAFPIMLAFTAMLPIVAVALEQWPNVLLFATYTAINLVGICRWLLPRRKAC